MPVTSGPMTVPGSRWPGVFIKGDVALAHAARLKRLCAAASKRAEQSGAEGDDNTEALDWLEVLELTKLLEQCRILS